MPSPLMIQAVADPVYLSRLKEEGYDTEQSFQTDDGRTITHSDIAASFDAAYARHRAEYIPKMGGKDRDNRKLQRKFKASIKDDVKDDFGLPSGWTVFFGIFMGIMGGPVGLALAIITCLFEYYMTKDLEKASVALISFA